MRGPPSRGPAQSLSPKGIPKKRKNTILIAAAALVAIVLVAAGCGNSAGGGSGASYSGAPYRSISKSSAASATKVGLAKTSLGRIVVDSKGRTLYLFEKDKNRRSACYGQCPTYWPPLLSHGKPLARPGVKRSLLGTTRRANGARQVTYGGHPLYRYSGDTKPGQTNGEGLHFFGGRWDVVSPAGKKVEANG
jgi:predicted lipoprotein with Yx(FWY)xxD motif